MRVCTTGIVIFVALTALAEAGPVDPAPPETLSQQLAESYAAVLTRCVGGKSADPKKRFAKFEITKIVKDPSNSLKKGGHIVVADYPTDKIGELFLLMGGKTDSGIRWQEIGFRGQSSPLHVNQATFKYIVDAPPPTLAVQRRLEYFVRFLESNERLIAEDAYDEFAKVPFKKLISLARRLPREKLRAWLFDGKAPRHRRGLYGSMLGLCGNAEDAKRMETEIVKNSTDSRAGLCGVMCGYLLLTGEKGLRVLERAKLKKGIVFAESYCAIYAVRFMRAEAPDRITRPRLNESMRLVLDLPELADLAIRDLERWKDWSIQDRLMKLYGVKPYHEVWFKRAIIRYMFAAANDESNSKSTPIPVHVSRGKKYLAALEKKDPELVEKLTKFLKSEKARNSIEKKKTSKH